MIPAQCTVCRHNFVSTAFAIDNANNLNLSNNIVRCPKCGGRAKLIDGKFSIAEGKFEVHSAPKWSRDLLAQFKLIAKKAEAENLAASDIIAEIGGVSPELARKLKGYGLTAAILVAFLTFLINHISIDVTYDINRGWDQFVHAMGGTIAPAPAQLDKPAPSTPSPPAPSPTPDSELPHATWAALPATQPNRQARRRRKAQDRKRR